MTLNIGDWIALGVVIAIVLGVIIYYTVKIVKMTPEDRKKKIVTYLKGVVALAEQELGSGQGEAKLEEVEAYFNKNAPILLKVLLFLTGKDSLKDLIEQALSEIKESFGTTNDDSSSD